MSEKKPNRISTVLRLARRRERDAGVNARRAEDEARASQERVAASIRHARSSAASRASSVAGFQHASQLDELRAQRVLDDEALHRDRMAAAVEARSVLLDAVRRRKSLERADDRHEKMRAVIATQAAQRALDEMGTRTNRTDEGSPR